MARSRAQLALSTRLMNVGIAALCRGGSLDRAKSVLVDAIRLGLPPDVVTYNTLLAAHCRAAGLDAGLAVVHRMREAGVSPDAVTYYSLIAGATCRLLTLRALDLFDEILRSGVVPDSWSYNAKLMHCLFRSGHPEDAYRVFMDMTEKGVAPSATTYNTLLYGLFRAGHATNAL